jgi:hypothetical protein
MCAESALQILYVLIVYDIMHGITCLNFGLVLGSFIHKAPFYLWWAMPSHGIGHILFGVPCTKMLNSPLVDLGFLEFALLPFYVKVVQGCYFFVI